MAHRNVVRLPALLCLLAGFILATPAAAQKPVQDPAKLAAAKTFLEASGQAKNFEAVLPLIMNQFVDVIGKAAPDKIGVVREAMQALTPRFLNRKQELFDDLAVLYAARMTVEDMQAATAFFKSPAGQRFVTLQPQMTQESMAIGQRWGQKLGQELEIELRQELKKRGITL